MRKTSILLLAIVLLCSFMLAGCGGDNKAAAPGAPAGGGKKLIIYTSMKESLIGGIVEGFKKKNPGIEVDISLPAQANSWPKSRQSDRVARFSQILSGQVRFQISTV